ncbi:MAG: phosphatidylglycerophosphatase A [Phycisphaerales bacterium]|jgi:phosphatidylglycerophosphatase A|nr:phosphatidylglycerophosphatase A [Phycisphaerales bacterium]
MKQNWNLLWCTNGGLGLLPKAPGTWGSLKPVFAVLVLGHFGSPPALTISILLVVVLVSSYITVNLAKWYETYFGRKDPPQVVCDEAAGQSIALLGMAWLEPHNHVSPQIWVSLAILAFMLFRFFDIVKPGPINAAQSLPNGWGVLMDDVFAGIAAGCIVFFAAALLG